MVMKSEGDGMHPASHYLVVTDPEHPTTWHLRVRDVHGKVDHILMGAAWAALHDGYRGNKYEGPDKEKALKSLMALYDKENMVEPGDKHPAGHTDMGEADHMAKSIATLSSDWVWLGISHNAYLDTTKDILPVALITKDMERQQKAIEAGRLKDFGGLWVNHSHTAEIGRAAFKAIVPDTRMMLEAGVVDTEAAKLLNGKAWPMSIGYWYTADKSGNYTEFVQYERSVLVGKQPANTLTWFKVYQREEAVSAALTKFIKESHQ